MALVDGHAILETVDQRFLAIVDANIHAIQPVCFYPFNKNLVDKPKCPKRGMVETGWFSPAWNRHIDLVRNLGRQFVKRQGGDQANDAIWRPERHSDEVGIA